MANPLYLKDIVSINDLSRRELELVLDTAARLKATPQPELLRHKVIASLFFEASTRTRLSLKPPCTAWRFGGRLCRQQQHLAGQEGGDAGGYHLGDRHLCRRHRDASPAGGGRPSGHGVLRPHPGGQRR